MTSTTTTALRHEQDSPLTTSSTTARSLGSVGLVLLALCVGIIGYLDLNASSLGVDPIRRTISEYGLHDQAYLFNTAVICLAFGSLAVLAALVVRRTVKAISVASVMMVLWSAGLVGVTLFPKHDWAVGPSASGNVHRVVSLVAFIALPIAVALIVRRRGAAARPVPARVAAWCAVLAVAWFAMIGVAIVNMAMGGQPWWQTIPLGLVERGLAGSELLAVAALAVWTIRGTPVSPRDRAL